MEAFLQLLGTLFATKCDLDPTAYYDGNYAPLLRNGDVFDFIVVGAGSAGAAVARRLSENPTWRILLIEAGGLPNVDSEIPLFDLGLMQTDLDWQFETQPLTTACLGFKDNICRLSQGKALGGSSTINSMLYVRGAPAIYDDWAAMGNTGWAWKDIQKYYKKLENVVNSDSLNYGRDGPVTVTYADKHFEIQDQIIKAAGEAGISVFNEEVDLGMSYIPMTLRDGRRESTAKAYLAKSGFRENNNVREVNIERSHRYVKNWGRLYYKPRLYTAYNSLVKKVVIKNKIAEGVIVEINGRDVLIKARREVVISAGVFNSAKLLMLSGIGPQKHLEELDIAVIQNLPVGRNLHDHLLNYGYYVKLNPLAPPNYYNDGLSYCLYKNGSFAANNIMDLMWFFSTNNDPLRANIYIQMLYTAPEDIWQLVPFIDAVGINEVTAANVYKDLETNSLLFLCTGLATPKSAGYVLLNSTNPHDKPLIYPQYLTHPEDIEAVISSLDEIVKLINTPTFKALNATIGYPDIPNCRGLDVATREYKECLFRNTMNTDFHATGTCRMGKVGDGNSVVDPDLRVIGVRKLRVIDASIMPITINRNTNAAAIMIGEKGADLIKRDNFGL